jgi:hypothetical protein
MKIKYLTVLEQNPSYANKITGFVLNLLPLSDNEIISLQNKYNKGNPFPVVLHELLSLAGNFCYVLDYGPADSQDEFQQDCREFLSDNAHKGHIISRPFFALDLYGGDQFLFVYLDENVDDPIVYQICPYKPVGHNKWLYSTDGTLSGLINVTMERFLNGRNPF